MLFLFPTISLANPSENTPPNPPEINGPQTGKIRQTYEYSFTLTDPDDGDFMFTMEVDFGDEVVIEGGAGCGKIWYSGTVLEMTYKWTTADTYGIKARVQDSYGDWSEWSEPFEVSMPKQMFHHPIITRLMERHPQLYQIINSLFS